MSRMNVIEHSPNLVHLAFRKDRDVLRYEIRGARNLDDAYAGEPGIARNGVAVIGTGTSRLLEVQEGYDFRSTSLKRRKLGLMEESNRNLTVIKYDPDEFVSATLPDAPPDLAFGYLTVREFRRASAAFTVEEDIYILPPPNFYTMPHPVLNIAGTAPLIAGTVAGQPALPESMVISLPKYMGSFSFTNSGANPIFAAHERGMPMRVIASGETISLTDTNQNLLILAATTGASTFSLVGAVMNAAI